MIQSMTGFGQGQARLNGLTIKAEIRAVNGRFRELNVKLPRFLAALEELVRQTVSESVSRGRVEVSLRLEGESPWQRLSVNRHLAGEYLKALQELKDSLGLEGRPDLALLSGLPGVVGLVEDTPEMGRLEPVLTEALSSALSEFTAMRRREGDKLVQDIGERLEAIAQRVEGVAEALPDLAREVLRKLQERLNNLLSQEIDPQRLAMEAAILADRSDVTEEVVRLRSHFGQFRRYLDQGGPVGRKLEFLLQEIHRELNTLGTKSAQAEVSQSIVEAKAELEKIREQIQNLE